MKILLSVLLLVASTFSEDTLRVAVSPFEPLVIRENGELQGFDIDIWKEISTELGVTTEFIFTEKFPNMFEMVKEGRADLAISGITINYDRELIFNFTHPYKRSGLAVLIRNEKESDIIGSLSGLFTGTFLNVWIFLTLFIIISAHLIWLTERGSDAFDDKYGTGIWQGLWWTFVTVTTVGYGDKVPKKPFSKVLAVLVMMVGIGVAGLAIGQITALTQLEVSKYSINGKEDLANRKVATVSGSTSEKIIKQLGAYPVGANNVDEAVLMLEAHKADAVIFDAPALQYKAKNNLNLVTVGDIFELQDYGILLPNDSKLKERISQIILLLMKNGKHQELKEKWFGT